MARKGFDRHGAMIFSHKDQAESYAKATLKKAFAGHLLSEAELAACRRELYWEPAEKLLERIKKG